MFSNAINNSLDINSPLSVSSALDEAATALTRMKSDRQTYEAFLRGANQAPSPSPLPPSAVVPHGQQHYQDEHPSEGEAAPLPPTVEEKPTGMCVNVIVCLSVCLSGALLFNTQCD